MAKDTLVLTDCDGCSEDCWPKDNFVFTAQGISDNVDNIMWASCAQEIIDWQGKWKSPSLSVPTQ